MKIGITGIANGGKTVFLTSLLWQLTELESADFTISPSIGIRGFKSRNRKTHPSDLFPFEHYREKLSSGGKWPAKTKASSHYTCQIYRKDWGKLNLGRFTRMRHLQFTNKQELDFFDFPGERIADAAIASFENYNDWCDHMLHHFQSHTDYSVAISPYLNLLDEIVANEDRNEGSINKRVIHAYKLALARLIYGYKPLVSPSTFLLDDKGCAAKKIPNDELARTRLAGLDAESQFAPLTLEARKAFPSMAKQMAKHYTAYRKKLVCPLFTEIIESKRLVILIDIPSLLVGGVDRYNDNRQILLDLFDALEPNGRLIALFQKLQTFLGLGLEKIAFVAVKSDLVHPDDVSSGKLESLLKQMTARAKGMLPDVEFGHFVCSAIYSTRAGREPRHLIGRPIQNNPNAQEVEFEISSLPETWPEDWKVGDFTFSEVLPDVPKCLMIPPKQVGVDRLFEFLLTDRGSL